MKVLVIDNYDSFTYNLVHIIRKLGIEPTIARNDKISLAEVAKFDKLFLSPGPGLPGEAGILKEIIKTYASTKDIFGICLGQQAIAEVFGGSLTNLDKVYHGVSSDIFIKNHDDIFKNIPPVIKAGRYHSWVVESASLPSDMEITASDESGQIMAIKHKEYNVVGVQFHPESIMTETGEKMIENFLNNYR